MFAFRVTFPTFLLIPSRNVNVGARVSLCEEIVVELLFDSIAIIPTLFTNLFLPQIRMITFRATKAVEVAISFQLQNVHFVVSPIAEISRRHSSRLSIQVSSKKTTDALASWMNCLWFSTLSFNVSLYCFSASITNRASEVTIRPKHLLFPKYGF